MLLGVYLLFFTGSEGIGVITAIIGFILYPTSGRGRKKKASHATSSHGYTHYYDDDHDHDDHDHGDHDSGGDSDSGGGGDD